MRTQGRVLETSGVSRVIGIYGGPAHDQSVAYVENGVVKLAMEEERPTRIKHCSPPPAHTPWMGLDWLSHEGYDFNNVDTVAFAEPLCNQSSHRDALVTMELPLWLEQRLAAREHHLCHAALAWAWSGWDECYALAIDGGGSMSYGLAAHCKNGVITEIARDNMAQLHSILNPGLWYLLSTIALGYKPLHDEGKVQALACSGNPNRYTALIRERLTIKPFYVEDPRLPGATRKDGTWHPSREMLQQLIGIDPQESSVKADVAAAVQTIFEEMIMTDVEAYIPRGCRLVLSGGCFCNVTINRKLLDWASEVFAASAMTDGGMAAGAGLLTGPIRPYRVDHVYLGYDAGPIPAGTDPARLARMIADGACVGLCYGRCEYGPRALGNRSILCDPTKSDTAAKVNAKLHRNSVMPFAPVILDTDADEVLEPAWRRASHSAEHMTMAFKVNEGWREKIPAVVHVDGTCRPQVLRESVSPFYYAILREFKKITGIGVLLNTSFNLHETPIIMSEADAMDVFDKGGVDVLVSTSGLKGR